MQEDLEDGPTSCESAGGHDAKKEAVTGMREVALMPVLREDGLDEVHS